MWSGNTLSLEWKLSNFTMETKMDFTMIDGCVFGIIGGITFPLTTLPMDQWKEGTDVVDHPALRRWELDCNRKYVTNED